MGPTITDDHAQLMETRPSRDDQVVEYSLASTAAPVAVATYTYDQLPDDVRKALPPADSITRAIDNTKP